MTLARHGLFPGFRGFLQSGQSVSRGAGAGGVKKPPREVVEVVSDGSGLCGIAGPDTVLAGLGGRITDDVDGAGTNPGVGSSENSAVMPMVYVNFMVWASRDSEPSVSDPESESVSSAT